MGYVSLITLGVADLARAERFYTALGWDRSPASVDGVVTFLIGTGRMVLSLYGRDALAHDSGVAAAGDGRSVALAVNVASPAQVRRLAERAVAAGGRVTAAPAQADWGGTTAYVTDPDGHLWEVAHNPGFPLADDGSITLPGG